jgi:DNA-binding NarL/FixJ family response regulator
VPEQRSSVVICEDHEIVYTGLKLILDQSLDFKIVGHAQSGQELLPLLEQSKANILILDLNLPDTDGFSLLKSVREVNKDIFVIILTMYQDLHLIQRAKDEGANAYLLKNASNEELLEALRQVNHKTFFVTRQLQTEGEHQDIFKDEFSQKMKLTRREIEIIRLLAMGNTSQQASVALTISPHTVDTHRKNIFRKLKINNIADLVRFAHDTKII